MPWKNGTPEERKAALIGCMPFVKAIYKEDFSPGERKFMEICWKANSSAFFKDINNCDPSDWLLNHKEEGQSYEEFWNSFRSNGDCKYSAPRAPLATLPTRINRKTICILPIGPFPSSKDLSADEKYGRVFSENEYCNEEIESSNPLLVWLKKYCSSFFCTANVVVLPPVAVKQVGCQYRVNEFTGRYQLNASEILGYLRKIKTSNQHCLVAVTMIDLYPRPSWNFVFGLASSTKGYVGGVGVFSFCRYDDKFYETWTLGEDVVKTHPDGSLDYSVFSKIPKSLDGTPPRIDGMLLLRACKVMAHEVGHMFGLKHCIWMQCLMNGTNHLQESDRRPPHLCPVCLRKLQAVLNFKILDRYKVLYRYTNPEVWNKGIAEDIPISHESPKISKREPVVDTGTKENQKSTPSFMQPTKSTARKKIRQMPPASENRFKRTINGRPMQKKSQPLTSNRQLHSSKHLSRDEKHKCEPVLSGVATPPLEEFRSYRIWLREAIEFIISNGKPSFVSSPNDDM